MELGLRHAALETQQQTIVMQSRIVDAFYVNHQRVRQRADFQQAIPVAARASQTRDFQAEHGPNVPEADFSHQPLEAVPANGRRARVPLILVDDVDTGCRPSQILGPLHQIILSHRTPRIFTDLEQSRLPDVDDGKTVKMVRTDFGRWMSSKHGTPPLRSPRQANEPRRYTRLTDLTYRLHDFGGHPRVQTRPEQESPALPMQCGEPASIHIIR